jgi:hypothetical protein
VARRKGDYEERCLGGEVAGGEVASGGGLWVSSGRGRGGEGVNPGKSKRMKQAPCHLARLSYCSFLPSERDKKEK